MITIINPSTTRAPTESSKGPTSVVLDIKRLFCFDILLELKLHFNIKVARSPFVPGEGCVINEEHRDLR